VSISNGSNELIATVLMNSMLSVAADYSSFALAQSNISNGPVELWDMGDWSSSEVSTSAFLWEVALARGGEQIAVPTYGGMRIFDSTMGELSLPVEFDSGTPVGAAYSPVENILFIAWENAPTTGASIDAFDSTTLEWIASLDTVDRFGRVGNRAFNEGRLRVSRDGTMLFATQEDAVLWYSFSPLQP
jgi:hypothetical protein